MCVERPILLKTEMVRQADAGVKTETRRIIKSQPGDHVWSCLNRGLNNYEFKKKIIQTDNNIVVRFSHVLNGHEDGVEYKRCPYGKPGDVLWVKETFRENYFDNGLTAYKALFSETSKEYVKEPKWKSSLFMPRAAARLFLEIKEINVERLQDIKIEDIRAEGITTKYSINEELFVMQEWEDLWNSINAEPKPVKRSGIINHYISYPWEDVQEVREHKGLPWHVYGNPWIWVVKFEKLDNYNG